MTAKPFSSAWLKDCADDVIELTRVYVLLGHTSALVNYLPPIL